MNKSIIRYLVSRVIQFEGVFLLLPCIVSLIYKEKIGFWYLLVAVAAGLIGTLGAFVKPQSKVFYAKEGFVTVSLSWILLSLIGALPFFLSGEIPSYTDALFETVSGFTTTGATILTDVEIMSKAGMFWRCFTIWVGGMGVIVFIMAVVPLSGSYNLHLMRAESTGTDVGKLVPKIKDTAKILYGMYLGLSILLFISLSVAGLGLYDAIVMVFSTMGTGGFGNYNDSLAGFSKAVQIINVVFMFLCGINFNAYFCIVRKKFKDILHIEEIRWYVCIVAIASVSIALSIKADYANFGDAFHASIFQVVSIMTTTGYSTVDFELWPMFCKVLLLFVMVLGGCAGSTSGGIKVSRGVILFRTIKREIEKLIHPRSVKKVRMDSKALSEETVGSVVSFFAAYVMILIISVIVVSLDNFDFGTTFSSVLSMVGNVGPGIGMVGPTGNFSIFSPCSKLMLIFDMLAGRLEILPMFVLLYFRTWKRD